MISGVVMFEASRISKNSKPLILIMSTSKKIKSTSVLIKKSLASIHELNSANKLIEEWSLDFFTVSMRCNAFGSITIALIIMTNWLGVR